MYCAKLTLFYVIAALAAMASASPVPVPAGGQLSNIDVIAREPLPLAEDLVVREPTPEELDARQCKRGKGVGCM